MNMTNRRNVIPLMEPAEKIILDAMYEVEKLPPDVKLTDAIILLKQAKDKVSDYIDERERIRYSGNWYGSNSCEM
jgi:hypothetical protein